MANQTLTNDKVELQRKLEERDRQIADLRRQLAAKDRLVETQRSVLEEASQSFSPALRAKVFFNYYHLAFRTAEILERIWFS